MDTVITSTGIKAEDVQKHGLTMSGLLDKLKAEVAPSFEKKGDLPVGVWVSEKDGGFEIYTVELIDLDAGYAGLDEDAQKKVWHDGYKRRYVNAPNHQAIKAKLGLIEHGGQTAKAVDKALWDVACEMARTGLTETQITAYTAGRVSADMAKKAVELANN